jgi:hypothetical protein
LECRVSDVEARVSSVATACSPSFKLGEVFSNTTEQELDFFDVDTGNEPELDTIESESAYVTKLAPNINSFDFSDLLKQVKSREINCQASDNILYERILNEVEKRKAALASLNDTQLILFLSQAHTDIKRIAPMEELQSRLEIYGYPTLHSRTVSIKTMSIAEIRDHLRKRNLSVQGTNEELLKRLSGSDYSEHLEAEKETKASATLDLKKMSESQLLRAISIRRLDSSASYETLRTRLYEYLSSLETILGCDRYQRTDLLLKVAKNFELDTIAPFSELKSRLEDYGYPVTHPFGVKRKFDETD